MKVNKLTKHSTLTEEEYHAFVEFKGVEIPFRVLRTTQISTTGTSFTAVSIKRVHTNYLEMPNITKGQKEKIREMITKQLEK